MPSAEERKNHIKKDLPVPGSQRARKKYGSKMATFQARGYQENDGTSVKNALLSGSWFRWKMVSLDFGVLITCEQMAGH